VGPRRLRQDDGNAVAPIRRFESIDGRQDLSGAGKDVTALPPERPPRYRAWCSRNYCDVSATLTVYQELSPSGLQMRRRSNGGEVGNRRGSYSVETGAARGRGRTDIRDSEPGGQQQARVRACTPAIAIQPAAYAAGTSPIQQSRRPRAARFDARTRFRRVAAEDLRITAIFVPHDRARALAMATVWGHGSAAGRSRIDTPLQSMPGRSIHFIAGS